MKFRLFISGVQKEFARERREIARYVRKDALFGKFFDVFLFEETPAGSGPAQGVYLKEAADYRAVFKPHTSLPPNELIAGPMYLKGYIERLGTGTEDVAKLCAKSGPPAPGFAEGVDFRAVLKRRRLGGVADSGAETGAKTDGTLNGTLSGTLNGAINGRLNPTAAKVLTYIVERPGCRASVIITDLSIPRDTLNKVVKRLSTGGFIERRGGKKTGGYYCVQQRADQPTTPPRHPKSPSSPRSPKSP